MTNTIASDKNWWPHRYDPAKDAFHYIAAGRDDHRKAVFLTDEYLPGADKPRAVPAKEAVAVVREMGAAPVHYIFHSAYCCSSLLARAFDIPGVSMGLKEPVVLNDIKGWQMRGAKAGPVLEALDGAVTVLSRPFSEGESVIIKPSNVINLFAEPMMQMRPNAKAVLLHAPLKDYLGSIARKGLLGRHWVRDLLQKHLRDGMIQLGIKNEDYLGLTDIQVAAVGWLTQHMLFHRLVKKFGPSRVMTLDSSRLMQSQKAAFSNLASHFDLSLSEQMVDDVIAGPAFNTHSKTNESFGEDQREQERLDGVSLHADEIEKVMVWAQMVADNVSLPMDLPSSLI